MCWVVKKSNLSLTVKPGQADGTFPCASCQSGFNMQIIELQPLSVNVKYFLFFSVVTVTILIYFPSLLSPSGVTKDRLWLFQTVSQCVGICSLQYALQMYDLIAMFTFICMSNSWLHNCVCYLYSKLYVRRLTTLMCWNLNRFYKQK